MHAWLGTADDILRQAPWVTRQIDSRRSLLRLVGVLVVFGLLYGAVMGSFRALAGQPQWLRQMAYSAVKVPLLLTGDVCDQLAELLRGEFAAGPAARFRQSVLRPGCGPGRPGDRLGFARAADAALVRVVGRHIITPCCSTAPCLLSPASPAQWLVRGYYRPLDRAESRHRLAAVVLAACVHGRGDSNGVAAAAVHRLAVRWTCSSCAATRGTTPTSTWRVWCGRRSFRERMRSGITGVRFRTHGKWPRSRSRRKS